MWPCQMYTKINRQFAEGANPSPVFIGPDGLEYFFKQLPFGALYYDDDCTGGDACKRPDGRCLAVVIPAIGGDGTARPSSFHVDHPSSGDGSGWTREGVPPEITVSPSINFEDSYHGWISQGYLTDDIEGRTYDRGP